MNQFEQDKLKDSNDGRWNLEEHIQFLQGFEQFGMNWSKISSIIPARTYSQIRSHSQKFVKKLKKCKDIELEIDFTSENIRNINDMIAHIKSVNEDYNIINVFLYLSEKCTQDIKRRKRVRKRGRAKININNILNEDMEKTSFNKIEYEIKNEKKENNENINDKDNNSYKQIINNNFYNAPINNIFINNINFFNGFNDINALNSLNQEYLNNSINSKNINNIFSQNNIFNEYI